MSIHVFYGHAKRRDSARPRCFYCNSRPRVHAVTYFGAPVCGKCWDEKWRKTEDGEFDPAYADIEHTSTGEWL